jgi:Protein ENHANCED DISEASE RESISTANCE 2, C-terminal
MDDDRNQAALVPSYQSPSPTVESSVLGNFMDNNPILFMGLFAGLTQVLRVAGTRVLTVDLDILMLVIFAAFCVGLHTPRPLVAGVDKAPVRPVKRRGTRLGGPPTPSSAVKLLRLSMISVTPRGASSTRDADPFVSKSAKEEELAREVEVGEDDDIVCINSPMPKFPEDAELGSMLNCWSETPASQFLVRGDKYLTDKKKVKSEPFLFPCRGIDLFLTDTCPENVGR